MRRLALAVLVVAPAGCAGEDPARVTVPERDDSPPATRIVLLDGAGHELAEASQPPEPGQPAHSTLHEPRLRGRAEGRDPDGGVARVRISIREEIVCRHPDGREETRPRTRYFPPSQIERIRSTPGARLPTKVTRTLALTLVGDRCGRAEAVSVHGELWGETTNGSGLESVTPHLRFVWPWKKGTAGIMPAVPNYGPIRTGRGTCHERALRFGRREAPIRCGFARTYVPSGWPTG